MSKNVAPEQVTATEFKKHQGSLLQKVVEGTRLALTRRGKRVASIEPVQEVLPLEERPTVKELQDRLEKGVRLVDSQDLESLVGIAKSLNEKPSVFVQTRGAEREGDLHQDILKVSEKLDPENLEKFVNIVRAYAKGGLKEGQK
jgi:antitoxin (DNA-binding transcriptional repressor) of toxin-antitoxin stability system